MGYWHGSMVWWHNGCLVVRHVCTLVRYICWCSGKGQYPAPGLREPSVRHHFLTLFSPPSFLKLVCYHHHYPYHFHLYYPMSYSQLLSLWQIPTWWENKKRELHHNHHPDYYHQFCLMVIITHPSSFPRPFFRRQVSSLLLCALGWAILSKKLSASDISAFLQLIGKLSLSNKIDLGIIETLSLSKMCTCFHPISTVKKKVRELPLYCWVA